MAALAYAHLSRLPVRVSRFGCGGFHLEICGEIIMGYLERTTLYYPTDKRPATSCVFTAFVNVLAKCFALLVYEALVGYYTTYIELNIKAMFFA